MEKTKLKKTRTIHLTHPASYFQAWNAGPSTVHNKFSSMRNNYDSRTYVPRAYDTRYEARYYDSGRNYESRRVNFFNCPKRQIDSRAWSQSLVRGPDPTAPHLKYGVFPKRRASSTRALPIHPPTKLYNSAHQQNYFARQSTQEFPPMKHPKKKLHHKKGVSDVPLYGNPNRRYTRHLSLSEIMHIDIKPKKMVAVTPSFCPSPTYKVMSSKLMGSPPISPR